MILAKMKMLFIDDTVCEHIILTYTQSLTEYRATLLLHLHKF